MPNISENDRQSHDVGAQNVCEFLYVHTRLNVTTIWCFLLDACELLRSFVCKERTVCHNNTKIIGHQYTEFHWLGNKVPCRKQQNIRTSLVISLWTIKIDFSLSVFYQFATVTSFSLLKVYVLVIFLLFIQTNAQYINSNVCLLYCAFVGLNNKLYTMHVTFIKILVNIRKWRIHRCLRERICHECWGFTVLSLLYRHIVASKHTLSVMLSAYGKMWQQDMLTVRGVSFVMVRS